MNLSERRIPRRHRPWAVWLLSVLVTCAGGTPSRAREGAESDTPVRLARNAVLGQIGGTDVYTFTVPGPSAESFVFDSLTDRSDLQWTLTGPGVTLSPNRSFPFSDAASVSDNELVVTLFPGDYGIQVRQTGRETPPYDFRLLKTSQAAPLTPGAPINAPLSPGNSTRLFQFVGAFGQQVRLNLAITNLPTGAIARLVNPFGGVLTRTQGGPSTPVTLLADGTYLVVLEGAVGNGASAGSFGLTVEPLGLESPYPAGEPIALNERIRFTNSVPFTNIYRFTLTQETALVFNPLTPSTGVFWELSGPPGILGRERFDEDHSDRRRAPAGEYRLAVWATTPDPGPADWILHDLATAQLIPLNTNVRATNAHNAADLYFRLPLTAGQRIYAQAISASGFSLSPYLKIWDPTGRPLFRQAWADAAFTAPFTGNYDVGLQSWVNETGTNGVREFRFHTVAFVTNDITVGQSVLGSLEMPGQARYYRFTLDQARAVSMDLLVSSDALWDLTGGAGRIAGGRFYNDGWFPFQLPAGDYTVEVSGSGPSTSPFGFRILDRNSGDPLTLGVATTVTVDPPSGTAVARIPLTAGQRFFPRSLGRTGFTRGTPGWRLEDPAGNRLFEASLDSEPGVRVAPVTGTYSLFVSGPLSEPVTGSATADVALLPVTDTTAPLTLGVAVNESIQSPGQVRRHTFTVAQTTRISIDILESSSAMFQLANAAGTVFAESRFWNEQWWMADLPPGAYSLTTYATGNETPVTRFRILTADGAPTVTLNTPFTAEVDTARGTRWMRLALEAGQRLIALPLSQTTWPSGRPSWRLMPPAGNPLFDSGFNPKGPFVVPASGIYDFFIGGSLGDSDSPASATFEIRTTPEDAVPLVLGSTISDQLSIPGQLRRYEFQLPADGLLSMDSQLPVNLQWRLLGPWGQAAGTRFWNDEWKPFGVPAGNYQLEVFGDGIQTEAYQFRLINPFAGTPLGVGTETLATFNPNAATLTYPLDLAAGQRIEARALERQNLPTAPTWSLVDPSGSRLFEGSFGSPEVMTATARVTGRHSLMLVGPLNDSGANGVVRFVVNSLGITPPPPFEGSPLAFGQEVSATLPNPEATNAFTFTLTQPAMLHVDALASSGQTVTVRNRYRVLQQDQPLAESDAGSRTGWILFRAEPGEYQIVVRGTGGYRFRLLDAATAPLIALDADVAITNAPANASHLRRFRGSAGDRIYFLGRPYSGFDQRPGYGVWGPNGDFLAGWYSDTQGVWDLPRDGDYYLSWGVPVTAAAPLGIHNVRLATIRDSTKPMTLNTPTTVSIPSPGGVAKLTFTLTAPTRVAMDAIADLGGAGQVYWRLESPGHRWISDKHWVGSDINGTPGPGGAFIDLPAGEFALSFWNSAPPGTPSFRFALWDLGSVATPFTVGTQVRGTNAPASQSRFYTFDAQAGDAFVFEGQGFSGYSTVTYADLYAPVGNGVELWRVDRTTDRFEVTATGRYQLIVSGNPEDTSAEGTHSFTLWHPLDRSRAITLGSVVSDRIETFGQRLRYSFSLARPGMVLLDNLDDRFELSMTLRGPMAVPFENTSVRNPESDSRQLKALPAGDYVATFWMPVGQTNAFRFRFLDALEAPVMTPGEPVTVSFAEARSTEVLRFNARAGDQFYLRAEGTTGFTAGASLRLLTEAGDPMFNQDTRFDVSTFSMPYTGAYYLVLNGSDWKPGEQGTYRFTLLPVSPSPSTPLFESTGDGPDLVVDGLSVTPSPIASGGTLSVQWTSRNAGTASATNGFTDRVVVRNAAGSVLADRILSAGTPPWMSGASLPRSTTLKLPDGPSAVGTLTVEVTTDSGNAVAERGNAGNAESNNRATTTVTGTLAPYPDLRISALQATPPTAWTPGNPVTLSWTLTNAGNGPAAAPWSTRLRVINRTTGVTVVDTEAPPVATLAAGGSVPQSIPFNVPAAPNAYGRFELSVTVDSSNDLFEYVADASAELNNTTTAEVVTGPDLAVLEVLAPPVAEPGVPFDVITVVTNQGNGTLEATWINAIAISTDPTPGNDTSLLFAPVNARLSPGQSLRQTNRVVVPITGDDGDQWVIVRADAGSALPEFDRSNNTGVSSDPVNVAKTLTLTPGTTTTRENAPAPFLMTVSRNGSAAADLTVTLASDAADELTVPSSILIPAGQKSATFDATPQPDDLLDGPQVVHLAASAPGFDSGRATITVLDDTAAKLGIQLSASQVPEGGSINAVIRRAPVLATPLTIQVQLSDASRVSAPSQVTIPGGQSSVTLPVSVPQNLTLQPPQSVALNISAPEYQPASSSFSVTDDDTPQVTLEVAPRSVSEGAGPNAASVTLTRRPVTAAPITVSLTAGGTGALTLPSTVVIPANTASLTFPVGVVNNTLVDGTRSVVIGGWVLDVTGSTKVSELSPDALEITDDDGPTLSLTLSAAAAPEGRNPALTGRISRNTSPSAALVVLLQSGNLGEARVPASVTIPAGATQATFLVETVEDGVTDGNQTVSITASASGYSSSTASLVVTDLNLPDLVVSRLTVPPNGIAGSVVPVSFRVENRGFAPVTTGFLQSVSLSESPVFGGGSLAAQLPWTTSVPPGGFLDQTANVRLPAKPGSFWIVVQADAARQIEELVEGNNILISEAPITSGSSYTATVTAEPKVALANTPITLSGSAVRASDATPAVGVPVEVHLDVRGIRRVIPAVTDGSGKFSAVFRPLPDEAGRYAAAAAFPGLAMPPAQDHFTLQGMRITAVPTLTVVERSSISGTTRLENLSDLPLTGLAVNVLSNTPGYQVTAELQSNRVEGDGGLNLAFVVNATAAASGNGFAHLRVQSAEGATGDLVLPIILERIVPRLVATPDPIATSMTLGRQRVVSFQVANSGGVATGPLELLLSSAPWLSAASPANLPPLPPGSTTTVDLLLSPAADLPLGNYQGEVVLRAENALLRVPFTFRAVSEARGSLQVTAEDEYTYFAEGAPRPTNAVVRVTDALSGTLVASGNGGTDGEITFPDLLEGEYVVTVTAEGHDDFRRSVHVSGAAPPPASIARADALSRHPVVRSAETGPALTAITAFLPRQTVRYVFSVVPTTVEDRYTVTVESTFETQVPVPVITVEPPSVDLTLFDGEEFQINFTISNQGLIAAQNVEFTLPSTAEFQMTPLISKIGKMAARTSLNIPVLVHRGPPKAAGIHARSLQRAQSTTARAPVAILPGIGGCTELGQVVYSYPCGPSEINRSAPVAVNVSNACNFLAAAAAAGEAFANAFSFLPNLCCSGNNGGAPGAYGPGATYRATPPTSPSSSSCSSGPPSPAPSNGAAQRSLARAAEDPGTAGSVCAKVRLRLDQRAVLTRDAFQAQLELANDTDSPLTDLSVSLAIVDTTGAPANALFGIRDPELTDLNAVDGSGTLGARAEGGARWTLIPSLNAAPTSGVRTFLVGGTIIYRQDGVRVTVPLTPASINVHPQPELIVRYFHQRDVFSDDPFTRVLEPAVPYSLAAQVLNVGYGTAQALRIESGQPQIVENEKGLLIDFQAVGTRVENAAVSPSLNVHLGEIEPGTNRIASWLFTSSLQGSFTNFAASFRQENPIEGVERLSLIRSVEIHELIRIVQEPGLRADGRPDMLVSSDSNPDVLPDILYGSDGNTRPVSASTNAVISGELSETNLRLRLDVALPRGLAYLRVRHPGGTNFILSRVLRPDGSDVGVGTNAWTTDRFIRGGALRPIRVDLLHLFDLDAPAYYTLEYAPAPPPVPDTTAPVSRVASLPASSPLNFPVAWNGTDDSSGIFSYNIYVSTDGGPFQIWLTNSPLTGAIYSGRSGGRYGFLASAIDRAGNIEPVRTSADTSTLVDTGNRRPVITAPPATTIERGELLAVQFSASDPDPNQRVFFTLLSGAPRGLALDPETGSIRWQTGDGDAPGSWNIRVRATDNGLPSEFAEASMALTLVGTNRPPVATTIPDLLITEGSLLEQPILATDADLPRQTLSRTLLEAPRAATLDANGVLRWKTRPDDGPGTNQIRIRISDNGTPPLSTEVAFKVFVRDTSFDLLVGVGSTNLYLGETSQVPLSINADPAVTQVSFRLPLEADRFASLALSALSDDVVAATVADNPGNGALVQLQLRPGASLTATRRIADLGFTSVPSGPAGIVEVLPQAIAATRGDGTAIEKTGARAGSIVLVGQDPILRLETGPRLVVFGISGRRYRVESAPTLQSPWDTVRTVTLTGPTAEVDVSATAPTSFLRVIAIP